MSKTIEQKLQSSLLRQKEGRLTKISSKANEDSLRALWFFLRNPARMGKESAKMILRLIFSSELAIRMRALTAVKRVISFFNLKSKFTIR
jgi:hypothetical protein